MVMGGIPSPTVLYRQDLTPILKPGNNIRIEPVSQFGYYTLPRSAVPEFLPEVEVNLATPFVTRLTAMSDTGQTSPISTKITTLDVGTLTLGHYRLYAKDPAVRFEIYQPATTARMANKAGPISFHKGTTDSLIKLGQWQLLPEIFVYEDRTPITIKAYNMDLDEVKDYARFGAVGYKYPLTVKDMPVDRVTKEPAEPVAVTIRVSERV
jgi:hypothetical protein